MTTAVIVQARMGSTRLPGKVLMPLGDKRVLAHVLTRCRAITAADKVCLATSSLSQDDIVASEGRRLGVVVFRGDENDVLSRYHSAARMLGAEEILRVTADCPLIDPEICNAVIRLRRKTGVDYACNFSPASFPHGLDCEAFNMDTLDRAQRFSSTAYQREHVTVWLIDNPAITKANLKQDGADASHHRWTLDTPDDYRVLSSIFTNCSAALASMHWRDLIECLERERSSGQANRN